MKPPKVSVVVLNYNGLEYLKNCFESLKNTKYSNFEVVMVDNRSTDQSISYAKGNYPWVKIIDAGSNSGWAAGNNFGIQNTKGKYVVLLNNDTICEPEWLAKLVDVAESDEKIAVVGAWPLRGEMSKFAQSMFPYKIEEVSTVSGAAMMVKRDIFEEIRASLKLDVKGMSEELYKGKAMNVPPALFDRMRRIYEELLEIKQIHGLGFPVKREKSEKEKLKGVFK
jgi:GT2 family glycosyltransferase